MFAYCLNNPTNCADTTGFATEFFAAREFDPTYPLAGGGFGSGGGTIALAPVLLMPISQWLDKLWDNISQSFARSVPRNYQSPNEVHHLVAKGSLGAKPAAMILNQVIPDGVENPINKISIKTGLHRRLHTNLYYGVTNYMVITAYCDADTPEEQQTNVIVTLLLLRGMVAALNKLAPY